MPIPKPAKGEKEQDFISRCMGNNTMNKDYPDQKQRSAICYSQWRRKEMIKFNFQVPIKEVYNQDQNQEQNKDNENKEFLIEGVAINATTTSNGHKYLAEELEISAKTLTGVPLLANHDNSVESIKGRVLEGKFSNNRVSFRAKVMDKSMKEMIKDGRLNSVSVGAHVESMEEDEDDGSFIARGIRFVELSLVAVGADEGATFGMALSEACKLSTDIQEEKVSTIKDKKEVDEEAPETVTKEELAATVAKEVEKAVAEALAKESEKRAKEEKAKQEAIEKEMKEKASKEAEEKAAKDKAEKEASEKAAKDKKAAEEKAAKDKAEKEAEEDEDDDEPEEKLSGKYKMIESYGTLKGGSLTIERGD